MTRYLISQTIKSASGFQYYEVEAGSKAEAMSKHAENKSTFTHEELEVTDVYDLTESDVMMIKEPGAMT